MTDYLTILASANGLASGNWNISPGMGFNDMNKWWGDGGLRDVAHNGIDLREYLYNDSDPYIIDGNTIVPAAGDGEIVCIIKDFLGQSMFVRHSQSESGRVILSAYGHMVPAHGLDIGTNIVGGDLLGKVAGQGSNIKIPPHLHYSIIEAVSAIDISSISWAMLEQAEWIKFNDPI